MTEFDADPRGVLRRMSPGGRLFMNFQQEASALKGVFPAESASRREDEAACRALLREGSKSFYAASLLLPVRLRRDVCSLYAFCRLADDEVDLGGGPLAAVAALGERLDAIYSGASVQGPVERAFAALVARREIPKNMPAALIEGFAWDAQGRSYETLAEVREYAVRVAGVVGMMMTLLMGVRSGEALARACDLGVAMQLTNIARDVGEDARGGRLYLPRDWFKAEGLDPDDWLARPRPRVEIARMTLRLLDEADRLYRRAEGGIALLPFDTRPAIWAARRIYGEIGAQTKRNGLDNVTRRAVVSKRRKAALIGRAFGSALTGRGAAPQPPLPEAAVFVAAVAQADRTPRGSLGARFVWTLELFERLEEAERARYASAHRNRAG